MFKNEIENVKSEIVEIENAINKENNAIIKKALQSELKKLTNKLDNLENKQKEFTAIDGLTTEEILLKYENKEIKLSKDSLDSLLKEKTQINFENYLKSKNIEYTKTTIMDRRLKTNGYILNVENDYYLLSYNHLTVKTVNSGNLIGFIVNNNHKLFKSDNCLKSIKEFIKFIFEKYNIDLNAVFSTENKDWGVNIKDNGDYIRALLLSMKIDIKNKTVILPYKNIEFENKELMNLIKELKY